MTTLSTQALPNVMKSKEAIKDMPYKHKKKSKISYNHFQEEQKKQGENPDGDNHDGGRSEVGQSNHYGDDENDCMLQEATGYIKMNHKVVRLVTKPRMIIFPIDNKAVFTVFSTLALRKFYNFNLPIYGVRDRDSRKTRGGGLRAMTN